MNGLDEHVPLRPSWVCRGCHLAWPCDEARQQLLVEYDDAPERLAIYLADMAQVAESDLLGSGLAADVRQRITNWPVVRWPGPTTSSSSWSSVYQRLSIQLYDRTVAGRQRQVRARGPR